MRALPTTGLLLLTLSACSASVSSPGESDADAVTQTTAVITFERVTTASEGRDVVRGAAAARFVQSRAGNAGATQGVDERALKLVGAAFDPPPVLGCITLGDEADSTGGRAIELADVGSLQVQALPNASPNASPNGSSNGDTRGAGKPFALVPRQVPDPVGLVGGVLYYAPSTDSSQVQPGARYAVRAAGSPGVPAFELTGTSPLEVADVRVTAHGSGALDVAWSTPDLGKDSGDVFFVDVVSPRASGSSSASGGGGLVRCAADASGAALPSSAFVADEVTLAVHRVHRERARANGRLESSELRFDFSRVVTFTRR
jgi:cell wall-associated NlpC family hydrolase